MMKFLNFFKNAGKGCRDITRCIQKAIDEKVVDLKKKNYDYFLPKISQQWFESVVVEDVRIRLEIEINYDYCVPGSKDIRVDVIGDDGSFLSFIRSRKGSFSITRQNELMD